MWTLALLLACSGTPSEVDDTANDSGDRDTSDTEDLGAAWWESQLQDADADGYTMLEGDCDDADPRANPGVRGDVCNGLDDDCDGKVDEDAPEDRWEPNDTSPATLGVLSGDALRVGYVFPAGDEDWFTFWIDDPDLSWFSMEVWVYSVPDGVDVALELYWVQDTEGDYRGLVAEGDREGQGGDEWLDFGGLLGRDDSGWYELRLVGLSGASCGHPYTLQFQEGGI